jgi:hypothetical protein
VNHRAFLACVLALLLGVVFGGPGCANGGSADTGGDDAGDDVTTEAGDAAACATGKTLCGGKCVALGSDGKNCGTCGKACGTSQVCNNGHCSYSCSPPQTLCGLPSTPDAGDDGSAPGADAGDASAAGGDSGSPDASSGGGDDGGGADAAAGDGGAVQPYCANLGTDNDNCGACGKVCLPEHVCSGGLCGLSCPPGQDPCTASDSCIPSGTCCSSNQCPVTGEICPMPGGQCTCPSGEHVCPVTNSCISNNDCCTNADCMSLQGSSCPTPGQACLCQNGQKACLMTGMCIPNNDCCISADCGTPGTNNVMNYTCTNGMCGLVCNAGCYNDDGQLSNGCECCDDGLGKACNTATGAALSMLGGTINQTGQLPGAGESDWLQVTFTNDAGNKNFHPHIYFVTNPNNEFAFDLVTSCGGQPLPCGDGGSCTGKTEWEVFYGPQATGNPGDPNWSPIGNIGTVYLRVHRVTGSPTCDTYQLVIKE